MIGPRLASAMPAEATSRIGEAIISPAMLAITSNGRLAIAVGPPHGHEDLGGIEELLVAPGLGAVPEGAERAGVGVLADFALVAGHGGELGLEGAGDVDPGVGDKGARIRPLGAARGVE